MQCPEGGAQLVPVKDKVKNTLAQEMAKASFPLTLRSPQPKEGDETGSPTNEMNTKENVNVSQKHSEGPPQDRPRGPPRLSNRRRRRASRPRSRENTSISMRTRSPCSWPGTPKRAFLPQGSTNCRWWKGTITTNRASRGEASKSFEGIGRVRGGIISIALKGRRRRMGRKLR